MRLSPILALLLVATAFAGCLAPADDEPVSPQARPDGSSGSGKSEGQAGTATMKNWSWAAIEDAKIRPGVQIVSPTGQCTSNFVFVDANGADVYLGLAAHCVDEMEIGDPVDIGESAKGTLAYSSWMTMDEADEKSGSAREYNDFALVRVDEAHRGMVHPAMRHFGGPTALADSGGVGTGDKVLTYGNSGLRMQIDPASWHEGYVLAQTDAWSTQVYTVTPGVPGDSGSGVLTGDGKALGVLVTLTIAPTAGSNGVTSLDLALAYAAEHAGVNVELATWDLLDPGLLPPR